MYSWQQGVLFLVRQESQECYVFISDVGIRGIYLSLTLCTAKFKQRDYSCSLVKSFSLQTTKWTTLVFVYYQTLSILGRWRFSIIICTCKIFFFSTGKHFGLLLPALHIFKKWKLPRCSAYFGSRSSGWYQGADFFTKFIPWKTRRRDLKIKMFGIRNRGKIAGFNEFDELPHFID